MTIAEIKQDLLNQVRQLELRLAGTQGALQVLQLIEDQDQELTMDSNSNPQQLSLIDNKDIYQTSLEEVIKE